MWFGVTVSLHQVKTQTLLAHKLLRTSGALKKKKTGEGFREAWGGSLCRVVRL